MNNEKMPPKPAISFATFHELTLGHFQPSQAPDREPDFISPSLSVYWDLGHGVVRSSDHWAGHHGCTGQASCIWTYGGAFAPGDWATGYCAYVDLSRRGRVPIEHVVTDLDRRGAEILGRAGGAVSLGMWQAEMARSPIPAWAEKIFPGPALLLPAAAALFRKETGLRHAVAARDERISAILGGAERVRIGMAWG